MIWSRNGRAASLGLPVGRPADGVELCHDRIFCLLALELFCGDDFRVAQVADFEMAEDGDAGQ